MRPDHRMVGHTGFLTTAAPGWLETGVTAEAVASQLAR